MRRRGGEEARRQGGEEVRPGCILEGGYRDIILDYLPATISVNCSVPDKKKERKIKFSSVIHHEATDAGRRTRRLGRDWLAPPRNLHVTKHPGHAQFGEGSTFSS